MASSILRGSALALACVVASALAACGGGQHISTLPAGGGQLGEDDGDSEARGTLQCRATIDEAAHLVERTDRCVGVECAVESLESRSLAGLGADEVETGWLVPEALLLDACATPVLPDGWVQVPIRESVYLGRPLAELSAERAESAETPWPSALLTSLSAADLDSLLVALRELQLPIHRTFVTAMPVSRPDAVQWRARARTEQQPAIEAESFRQFVMRAILASEAPWARGMASYLYVGFVHNNWNGNREAKVMRWLRAFSLHRESINGEPHETSEVAGVVLGLCLEARIRERGAPESPLGEQERESWIPELDQRHLIDPSACLAEFGMRLASIRFEAASADDLLHTTLSAAPESLTISCTTSPEPESTGRSAEMDSAPAPAQPAAPDGYVNFPNLRVVTSSGPLEAGEILVAVHGLRIRTHEDVSWALRELNPGDRFIVVTEGESGTVRRTLRVPRVQRETRVRLHILAR